MATLANAADVLRCFTPERLELTLTDVVALLGTPKSSTSRLLRAMRDAGFLEMAPGSRRYRPGIMIFELGTTYRRASTLLARADEAVGRLSRRFGHTGYVSVLDGADVVGVAHHEGSSTLRVGTPIGRRLAAFSSSTGRSLLARRGDAEVRALHPEPLRPASPHSPRDMNALLALLAEVRHQGYAISLEEANPGVGGLAVAVGERATGEEVSLNLVYPVATVSVSERQAMLHALLAEATEIATLVDDPWLAARRAA
ncbi:IclR family transcriptional regulator [Roseomonas marmotae]|uniref:IclR family transcriptional regulator n=1 Tax=Roseomonas marmotae TaxID=2768161 RepID=A0ABS3KBL5_9PROT|nr:IclR family transcriptional regulator [Roseomonas marmotae]MBO1074861.1 IclR family transcriptional regulator [Roseomonas marmotae]QTI80634.1 IclR family transcriptional regulator [Roseomonas marmotae]